MGKGKKKDERPGDVSTAELLTELATLDNVTAYIPTYNEHMQGVYPTWCELMLEITREAGKDGPGEWPLAHRIPLRRHDGELIIEVLDDVLHPTRGGGAADTIWSALDDAIDRIMKRVNKRKNPREGDIGEAVGLTRALALLVTPFEPDEDAIKEVAMERYAIRNRLGAA